eukprot:jgi/Mesvir1/18985/Mv25787-RA.2
MTDSSTSATTSPCGCMGDSIPPNDDAGNNGRQPCKDASSHGMEAAANDCYPPLGPCSVDLAFLSPQGALKWMLVFGRPSHRLVWHDASPGGGRAMGARVDHLLAYATAMPLSTRPASIVLFALHGVGDGVKRELTRAYPCMVEVALGAVQMVTLPPTVPPSPFGLSVAAPVSGIQAPIQDVPSRPLLLEPPISTAAVTATAVAGRARSSLGNSRCGGPGLPEWFEVPCGAACVIGKGQKGSPTHSAMVGRPTSTDHGMVGSTDAMAVDGSSEHEGGQAACGGSDSDSDGLVIRAGGSWSDSEGEDGSHMCEGDAVEVAVASVALGGSTHAKNRADGCGSPCGQARDVVAPPPPCHAHATRGPTSLDDRWREPSSSSLVTVSADRFSSAAGEATRLRGHTAHGATFGPPLPALVGRNVPAGGAPWEQVVNLDTSALVAMASDVSHGGAPILLAVSEERRREWFGGNAGFMEEQVMLTGIQSLKYAHI